MKFWFDDGLLEDFTKTRPFLKEVGATGIFAIVTGWVGKPGYMSIEQIKTLIQEGHEIASHGTEHKLMKDMDLGETRGVLCLSKEWIIKNLGVNAVAFVAPWNILRSDQEDMALKHYGAVRPPTFMHFHSRNQTDVRTTIPKYLKGPCPARAQIRRLRYHGSLAYVRRKFGCDFCGT